MLNVIYIISVWRKRAPSPNQDTDRMSHGFFLLDSLMPSSMGLRPQRRRRQAIYFLLKYDFSVQFVWCPSCIFSGWLHPSQRIADVNLMEWTTLKPAEQATVASSTRQQNCPCVSSPFSWSECVCLCSKFAKFKYNIFTHPFFPLEQKKCAFSFDWISTILEALRSLNGTVHCLAKDDFHSDWMRVFTNNTYFVCLRLYRGTCTMWNAIKCQPGKIWLKTIVFCGKRKNRSTISQFHLQTLDRSRTVVPSTEPDRTSISPN